MNKNREEFNMNKTFEEVKAMAPEERQDELDRVRDALQRIEEMDRAQLLKAMDLDSSKDNTKRLHQRARAMFLRGSPSFDLWI